MVINIKISATCFGSLNNHQAKYQNTELVHSASAHWLNVPLLYLIFGLMMFQWTETCRRNFNIDYQHMVCYWLGNLPYYCKTQRDGSYQSTVHIYTQTIHRTTQLKTLVGRLSGIRTQSGQTKINDELPLKNYHLIGKSAGRAPSLRVISCHLPYNWRKSTQNPQSG